MTHTQLVERAARWLAGSAGCLVVLTETRCMSLREIPDAIGWTSVGWSILVECKVSRSDFAKDQKKTGKDRGLGQERWYLTPAGLIGLDDLPVGWGLLEYHEGSDRITRRFPAPNTRSTSRRSSKVEWSDTAIRLDLRLVLAALRRVQIGEDAAKGILRQLMAKHDLQASDSAGSKEWSLDVTLSDPDGLPVTEADAVDLMDLIIDWAESRKLHVGGGIVPCEDGLEQDCQP